MGNNGIYYIATTTMTAHKFLIEIFFKNYHRGSPYLAVGPPGSVRNSLALISTTFGG